jgi:hypothetical protein
MYHHFSFIFRKPFHKKRSSWWLICKIYTIWCWQIEQRIEDNLSGTRSSTSALKPRVKRIVATRVRVEGSLFCLQTSNSSDLMGLSKNVHVWRRLLLVSEMAHHIHRLWCVGGGESPFGHEVPHGHYGHFEGLQQTITNTRSLQSAANQGIELDTYRIQVYNVMCRSVSGIANFLYDRIHNVKELEGGHITLQLTENSTITRPICLCFIKPFYGSTALVGLDHFTA